MAVIRSAATARGGREQLLALAAGRRDLINLGRGDPDLPTPRHIIDAAKRAMDEGDTHYTSWHGRADLREAIAAKCRADYGASVEADQVVVTAGAQEAMYVTFQGLLDPGDEVLLSDPHYISYPRGVRLAGGVAVSVPLREANNFVLDPADVEAGLTPRSKILVVITPDNPTGAVMPPETVAALAEIARRHKLYVIADDIYERFIYEGLPHRSIASEPGLADRLIMINGFSKTYAMTGWRLGYMVAPRALVPAMEVVKHTLTVCASSISQAAGLAALTGPQDCVEEMRRTYAARREILLGGFERLGMGGRWSRGALYLYPKVAAKGLSSYDFCLRMLTEANVLIFPGSAFGAGEGYLRVTLLQPAGKLRTMVDRMASVFPAHP